MKDGAQSRGMIGSMRGPIMATFGECRPGCRIRRVFSEIAPNQASGAEPSYLDIDKVRVSVVGR